MQKPALILFFTLLSPPALAAEPKPAEQIAALVQQSLLAKPACEAFRKAVHELVPAQGDPKGLANKADALKLLAQARKYPGKPAAFKKALDAVAAENHRSGEVSKDVARSIAEGYGCDIMSELDAFRPLIQGAGPLGFSAKERAALADAVYDRIIQDFDSSTTLIELMIGGHLLTSLIDEKVIEVSDAIFVENLRWNEQANQARLEVMEAVRKDPLQIGLELQLTEPLRASLFRLAKRLSSQR